MKCVPCDYFETPILSQCQEFYTYQGGGEEGASGDAIAAWLDGLTQVVASIAIDHDDGLCDRHGRLLKSNDIVVISICYLADAIKSERRFDDVSGVWGYTSRSCTAPIVCPKNPFFFKETVFARVLYSNV